MPNPDGTYTPAEIANLMKKGPGAAEPTPVATPKAEAPVVAPKPAPKPKVEVPAVPKADWDSIPTPKPHGFEQDAAPPQDFGRPPRKGEAAFKDENGQWHTADASVPGAPEPVFNPDSTKLQDTTTPSGENYKYTGSPASAYAQRLYETARRGKESQQKLESGTSWDAYRQVLLGNKEEPEGFGNVPGVGQVARYINNQFDTDAERAAAGREALDVAQSLTTENVAGINDPEAVYNLVAQEYGGDAKANIATGRAYHKLMSYYLQKHVRPTSTTAERVALAHQAKDWAARTLKGLRYFGELPVDLETLRQTPEFETKWEDLIPGVEDLANPSAWNERLQRFGREYSTAFSPKAEILPGGTVTEGEGPVDWFFRMEFGTLGAKVTAAEAMLPSSWGGEGRVPQPAELLKGLYGGKSALTEVVENPYLIEQLSSDNPEEKVKGWATLLLAGGIDLTSTTTTGELSELLHAPAQLRLLRKMSQEYKAAVEAERLANPNRRLASIAREVAERNLRPTTASGEALALGTKVEDVRIPLAEKSKEAIKAEDAARAEAARGAKAEERTAALERTQTPEDAYRTVEEERPPKGMDDEYLNRVTENMKRDEDVAIFLRRSGTGGKALYQDPIRRLEGTKMLPQEIERVNYELASVTKEVEPKVTELEADRAAFKTWMKDAKERITNGAFTEGDYAKEHALLRAKLKSKLEALKPLLRNQVKLQRELKGAEKYEELYAKASDFERRRLVEAVKSDKPLPSYFEGKAPPASFEARSPVDLPVEGGPPSAKATESILKPSPANLLETKGRGLATREQRANVAKRLLDEAGIPMDPNVKDPLVQLERILHTSPAKVQERITDLEQQASELRKANPWLMDLQNTDSATVENVQAQVNALLNPDATEEERAQAEHLVLLLGMTHPKWQELLPQVAVWQREMRYGNASTWSFALTGEYYSTPGGLLKGFKNEILEPRQADAIWARYVDRQRYAIRRHLTDSPDFALFCGFDAGDLPKTGDDLWAGMAKTSKGSVPAPSVNSWFRSKLIEFGASESGLSKEHILTNDLVWVGDAKASGAFAKAVPDAWVPGSIHLEEGMKTTVIHARSFKPAEERIRPGITAITKENKKWYGGVPVTPKTGFLAKVREVNADGTVTVEALQFEREGSPRHVPTGFVTKTKAQHLDYFERGRVQYQKIAEESGAERTEARAMTPAEMRDPKKGNHGQTGVKYIGPQVERFQPFAPPVQYTRENFEWSPADLGNISFEDYKRLQEKGRLRDSTPGRIPAPRLMPTSPLEAGPDFIENLMVELQKPSSISEGAGREGIELTLAYALQQGVISEDIHDASLFFLDQLPAAITHDTALMFVEDLQGARGVTTPARVEPLSFSDYSKNPNQGYLLHLVALKNPSEKDAGDLILTLSHEYGHVIHERLPNELRQEVSEAYKAAKAKGATKRKGFMSFFSKYSTEELAESEWFAWQFSEYMSHDVLPAAAKMEPSGKLVQLFERVKLEISKFVSDILRFGPWKAADPTVQRITDDVLEGRVTLHRIPNQPAEEALSLARPRTVENTVKETEDVARPVKTARSHAEVLATRYQELGRKIVDQHAEAVRLRRAQGRLKDSWDVLSEELRQTVDDLSIYEDETKARMGAAFTKDAPVAVGFEARTPMEVRVNEHLRAELDKVAQPELAYPTIVLAQHLAEGLAAQAHLEGDTAKTADHFLEALLDTSLSAKGDGEYNPFLLMDKMGDAAPVQAAVATLDLTHIQNRYKVPFEKLQAWAKELPAGSPDPAQVEEVQKLLYSGVKNEQVPLENIPANYGEWVPRVGRVKGEKSGVELLKSVQNRLVTQERKATAGTIKNQVRQMVGTMRDWFNPSRDVMDRSLTPAVRNLLRDGDATNNKVNEELNALMQELEREGDASKPGALVAKADHLYPNTSRSWNESFIGGTLNADALEEVSLAYVDREKFREAPQVKKELADLVKAHMARGEDLSTVREALLARTRELVPNALADERLGDLVFVKNATLSAQHHEMLLELHGLGAVLGPEEQKLAAEWATGTSSASEGARLVAMGVDDPNAYRKALGGNFAPGGEDLNEAIQKPFVQLATLSRDRKVQQFEDVSVAAGKPAVPWSVRQHMLAQILEGRSITQPNLVNKTGLQGRSAFKKVLTTGMFIASPVFHLGNKFGDFVANVDRLGILGGLRVEAAVAFRELLAVPFVNNAKIIFKNFAGKFGEKADKAFDHFLTLGAYSQDVIALQRGEGELVLTDGRRYNNAGLLQIARRMAVNDTFQSSEIVRSANGYLARRHGFGGKVWRHLAEQYDQTTAVAQQISEARRYGLFLELIKSGKEPMEAARIATETLIDYKHNLHPIDRAFYIDMVYPFWNFTKGNNRRFTRLMMSPDLWYAPARTHRFIDTVTDIASQAFDSRDQWQFNVDDMPPDVRARYDRLAALWKSKGLQRYSLASLMYAANEEMMLNPEGDVSARNTPAMQFLAEAREVYGPDFDGFLQQYYMPDPSRWGMPDLLADRNVIWTPDAQKSSMNVWTNGKDTSASDGTWNAIVSPANPDVDSMTFQYRVARTVYDLSYLFRSWFIQPISLGLLKDEGPEDVRLQGMTDNLMKLTGNATSRSPLVAGGSLWFSQIDPRDIGLNGTPISEDVARNLPSSAYTVTMETHGDPDSPDGAVQVPVYRLLPHFENAYLLSTLVTGLPFSTGTNWMGKAPGRSSFTPDEQRELQKYFFGISTVHADPASRINQMEAQAADRLMSVQGGKKPTVPMMDSATSRLSQRQSAEAFLLNAPEAARPVLLQRAEEKIRSLPSFDGAIASDMMALRLVGLGRVILLQRGVPVDQVDAMAPEQVLSAVRAKSR